MALWIAAFQKLTVASGADLTLLQVTAAANHQLKIHEVAIFQFGVSATQAASEFHLIRTTTSGTFSSLTVRQLNDSDADAADFSAGETFTAEPTTGSILHRLAIHPQAGIILPFPRALKVGAGDRLSILSKNIGTGTDMVGYMIVEE